MCGVRGAAVFDMRKGFDARPSGDLVTGVAGIPATVRESLGSALDRPPWWAIEMKATTKQELRLCWACGGARIEPRF
jgi:hypothetical protein